MFPMERFLTSSSRAAAAQVDPSRVTWVAYWSGILIIVVIAAAALIILVRKALNRPAAGSFESPGLDLDDLDSIQLEKVWQQTFNSLKEKDNGAC